MMMIFFPASLSFWTILLDFQDKGTGGIHQMKSIFLNDLINVPGHAVGSDDHGPFRDCLKFFRRIEDRDAFFLQIMDHLFVVNDGSVGVNGANALLHLFINRIYGPLHAKAKACGLQLGSLSCFLTLPIQFLDGLDHLINIHMGCIQVNGILRLF